MTAHETEKVINLFDDLLDELATWNLISDEDFKNLENIYYKIGGK